MFRFRVDYRSVFAIVLGLLGSDLAVNASPIDWYVSDGITPPRPQMRAEMSRDAAVFEQLQIAAVLAVLRYELSEGVWRDLSREDRARLRVWPMVTSEGSGSARSGAS
jgi:hypothetical protein